VQAAFVAAGAAQCGFCTPGFVVAAAALVDGAVEAGRPLGAADVREGLAGNLCRCTGYASIVAAVESAAAVSLAGRGRTT
jgi:aerobic-type carbon monoxide dehydrogenase small subunit (CoxS/CutS family)